MIKRYDLAINGIVESDDGNYVLYDDHEAMLEAIGAGGVGSERITQQTKSLEQHRAGFERWFSNGYQWLRRIERHPEVADDYAAQETAVAWHAWKAARGITE